MPYARSWNRCSSARACLDDARRRCDQDADECFPARLQGRPAFHRLHPKSKDDAESRPQALNVELRSWGGGGRDRAHSLLAFIRSPPAVAGLFVVNCHAKQNRECTRLRTSLPSSQPPSLKLRRTKKATT